jgi:hypothetical protein
MHASAELCRVGLQGFNFIEGISAHSVEVESAYADGIVKRFPPCFRCAAMKCDDPNCNNILIEPQVGCFLSFIKIFRHAMMSPHNTFLSVEDDIFFLDHFRDLASVALSPESLESLGFFSDEPCLIGLGRGASPDEVFTSVSGWNFVPRRKQPQNPCFAFNKAFARLAISRFHMIAHTADVYIHFEISDQAHHYSLEPPLAKELSSSVGSLPSRIHPKAVAATHEGNSEDARREAKEALRHHKKHVHVTPLLVLGIPRGGTGYMAHALTALGLDIGHEALGSDGISSWLFAVDDVDLPFGEAGYARNSKFVHPEKIVAVIRSSPAAIASLQVENAKNIQSYSFRRRWIKKIFDIDLDSFGTALDRALASYVYWYRIVETKKPIAWVRLEHAAGDLANLQSVGIIQTTKTPGPTELDRIVNSRKSYFGQIYDPQPLDIEQIIGDADRFLVDEYFKLQGELYTDFNPHC